MVDVTKLAIEVAIVTAAVVVVSIVAAAAAAAAAVVAVFIVVKRSMGRCMQGLQTTVSKQRCIGLSSASSKGTA